MNLSSNTNSEILRLFWGKSRPFHPLIFHMIDVGCITQSLINSKAFSPVKSYLKDTLKLNSIDLINWLGFLTAHHDIGKCSPDFQDKGDETTLDPLIKENLPFRPYIKPKFRHNVLSSKWILEHLKKKGWGLKSILIVSKAFLGHHGNFHDTSYSEAPIHEKEWNPYRNEMSSLIENYFTINDWTPDKFENSNVIGTIFIGILVLSDWIASNHQLYHDGVNYEQISELTFDEFFEYSKLQAARTVNRLGFDNNIDWSQKETFKKVWPEFKSLRPIQKETDLLSKNLKDFGLIIIEAPMGEGKTESAIHLATRWMGLNKSSGIYIALPTTATSNQMFDRLKLFLGEIDKSEIEKIRLVHGTAWLMDEISSNFTLKAEDHNSEEDKTDEYAYQWFKPLRRAFFASYGVGTIDQALMSVLKVKFGFLRLLGLSGKVLIIDEVHAYDAYMSRILERLLQWSSSLDIKVIMLSATLPSSRRKKLIKSYQKEEFLANLDLNFKNGEEMSQYPLITVANRTGTVETIPVEKGNNRKEIILLKEEGLLDNFEQIAKMAVESALEEKCVCVICNTVKNSQILYKRIKSLIQSRDDDVILTLFHSRFPIERRNEIEKLVLKLYDKSSIEIENRRPLKAILVATQVVEQSLDLDFDEMFSEIAPIDLLLQRLGRLHRHVRSKRNYLSKFHVLMPKIKKNQKIDFSLTEKIYSRYILLRTLIVIKAKDSIFLPDDIRSLVENVYNHQVILNPIGFTIEESDMKSAWDGIKKELEKEEAQAGKYLIPHPVSREFSVAIQKGRTFNEDDNEATSYLNAKTRLGDDHIRIILLEGNSFEDVLSKKLRPPLKILSEIYKKTVSVARYWIENISEYENFILPIQGPRWLSNLKILRLKDGIWKCTAFRNKIRIIHYDTNLGLQMYYEEKL